MTFQIRIFGAIVHGINLYSLMKKDTKIDVIKRSMNPGCTISSGRWKAYTDLTHSII